MLGIHILQILGFRPSAGKVLVTRNMFGVQGLRALSSVSRMMIDASMVFLDFAPFSRTLHFTLPEAGTRSSDGDDESRREIRIF